ncbi:MAG TPA: SurA N-terminal domain-containing protein [Streptosporangiaceae bacterium]
MFRTFVCVTGAVLAAVVALTGCGPVRLGAAAIVGDQRISAADLTDQVDNLETAYRASNGAIQLQFPQSQLPQQVLGWMLRFQIGEQLAARNHITVTRGETQRALARITSQAQQQGGGTSKVKLADLAVANGLPPDLLPELGRYQAIQNAVIRQLDGGTLPTSQSALQQLSQALGRRQCLAAKSLHITINPQYGRMDYSRIAVIPAALTLSAPESGPSPQPSARLTPAC